jgi:hypothetical protein
MLIAVAKRLFTLEFIRPFARPSRVCDCPSDRFDGRLNLDEIFDRSRHFAGLVFNRQGLNAPVQLAKNTLKITQILVQHDLSPPSAYPEESCSAEK